MDTAERHRRHDELWQNAVVDGLARALDVLHDISDELRQLSERTPLAQPETPAAPDSPASALLSIDDLAEYLGTSPGFIRSLRSTGKGPTVTKIGSRVFFHRSDVDAWLRDAREPDTEPTRPWRGAYLPGRVGWNVPRSSEPQTRPWCAGSNTEPLAASRYTGRAVCRVCRDDVLVNRDGRLRKHRQF
jgi:excisionase family DNA binding protein